VSEPAALVIDILVQPRAARPGVGPLVGDRLRVAVTAPPVDGRANAAVVEALADAFGVRRADVSIVRGETGRRKTVRIAGATRATLDRLAGQS
jgi:uncharacterized protein (TIGR00251 family)